MNNRSLPSRSLLAAAVVSALGTGAASAIADEGHIEETIVTAPIHRQEAETAHPVSVLSGEELKRQLASTLGATLDQQPGVSFASFGPGVGQPIIRGQAAPRVMVLQNGMPSADAANTSNDHANAVEPVLAQRIEVLRGPSTLLYGGGAIGGVVNVIDGRIPAALPDGIDGALEYRHGSNAATDIIAGRISAGAGPFAVYVDGFSRDNDDIEIDGFADADGEGMPGVIENSAAEAESYTLGLSWVGERGHIGFAYNRLENNYGIPPGAHEHHAHGDEHEDHEEEHMDEDHEHEHGEEEEFVRLDLVQDRYDLQAELVQPIPGIEAVRGKLGYVEYQHVELEGSEVGTRFDNESLEGRLEIVHRSSDALHGAVGLQVMDRDFSALGEEAFVPPATTRSIGLFAVQDLHLGAVTWEMGLRANRDVHDPVNGFSETFDTMSGSLSALWQASERDSFVLALSAAQRAPTVEELFSDGFHVATGSFEIGDPTLGEETSFNLDLGYHLHGERVDVQVDLFVNEMRDYIYQENTGLAFNPDLDAIESVCSADDEDECSPVRQWRADDALFLGMEAQLDYAISDALTLSLFGDVVRGELDRAGDVPRLTPARLGSQIEWQQGSWDLALRVTEVFDQDRPGRGETETEGYTAVSARAEYRQAVGDSTWTLFLHGENLLDEETRNATSLLRDLAPEPGLNVEAGIRMEF